MPTLYELRFKPFKSDIPYSRSEPPPSKSCGQLSESSSAKKIKRNKEFSKTKKSIFKKNIYIKLCF